MKVEFGILGPLQALVDGSPVSLGGRQQRAVLAILLAQANQTVPAERLIDGVWDDPPETAGNVLQGYVSQLRKAVGRNAIATRGRGYAAVVPSGTLDLHRFEQSAEAGTAERERGSAVDSSAYLTAALALWRGPALSDLADLPGVLPIAARLDALRLAAVERRIEADLDCGREAEAAAELEGLIAEHPLRERLRWLRMLALYRAGRQAEALEAYRAARETLVDELGIEPSKELGELEAAILRHDPSLSPPHADGAAVVVDAPAPTRAILIAALMTSSLATLIGLGSPLARRSGRELVLASTVSSSDELLGVTRRLREAGDPLADQGVVARVAAFTSVAPGADLARLATEQDVDLLLVDAPKGLLEDQRVLSLLDDAPCDVAVVVGDGSASEGPVLVPFSGFEHDWAAVELGAWLAQSLECPMRLAGPSRGPGGRDASRLLASASLAVQRALGVQADPVIVEPSPAALVAVARDAGVIVVGLTERWQREGLGSARTALATATGIPTLLVRRGLRPGGLAPQTTETRFTWTIAAASG